LPLPSITGRGRSWEQRFGASKVKSIALGNCVLTNVPVAILDLSGLNRERNSPETGSHIVSSHYLAHINGVLGASEMMKFGTFVDCTRQMLCPCICGIPIRAEISTRFVARSWPRCGRWPALPSSMIAGPSPQTAKDLARCSGRLSFQKREPLLYLRRLWTIQGGCCKSRFLRREFF